jgi:hypothetical protein
LRNSTLKPTATRSSGYAALLALLLGGALAGCGGGGESGTIAAAAISGGEDPTAANVTVQIVVPLVQMTAHVGDVVEVHFEASSGGLVATIDLLADSDGDIDTTDDQILIAAGLPETDGIPLALLWMTNGVPPGDYKILARMYLADPMAPLVEAAVSLGGYTLIS